MQTEEILSAGIDIGTSTTQLVFSRMLLQNTGGFGKIPQIKVISKEVIYSGKAQTGFIFFFWGCAIAWFLYMIPKIHLEYFGGIAMDSLPPLNERVSDIFGLVWWCYTGFETCVSMGAQTKYPQYTLPRALKVSVFLVFVCNALFQWFLVGLVPHKFYPLLAAADAPYAEGSGGSRTYRIPDHPSLHRNCILVVTCLRSTLVLQLRQDISIQWQKINLFLPSSAKYIRNTKHHTLQLQQ